MNRYGVVVIAVILSTVAIGARAQETINPTFDTDLSGWTVFLSPSHQWSPIDAADAIDSGSLLALKETGGGALVRATQCIAVDPGMVLLFMVRTLVVDTGNAADITIDLTPHSDELCQTPTGLNRVIETPPAGEWTRIINGPHTVPDGVQSIEVGLGLFENWAASVPVSAHFDDAQFILFMDGFETGSCGEWSSAIPSCGLVGAGLR